MQKLLGVFLLLMVCTQLTYAEEAESGDSWNVSWTPYIWAASLDADVKLGPAGGSGSLDFDDILDKLDMTYMHHLDINNGRWGFLNEIIYFDLSDTKSAPIAGVASAKVNSKQGIYDFAGTYRIGDDGTGLVIFGARYIDLEMGITTSSAIPGFNRNINLNESWTNLLLGVQKSFPLAENWDVAVKGDIATDYSDELSYILTLGFNYTMTDLLDLKFGYRYAGLEYENNQFEFDEKAGGAFVGLTFNW